MAGDWATSQGIDVLIGLDAFSHSGYTIHP
jgi:hypothetical protein